MDDFDALPRSLQLQIDAAFGATTDAHSGEPPPRKRPKIGLSLELTPVGGFILEDAPGGFILPGENAEVDNATSEDDLMPLSLVPAALQWLDLPPDDEEILQVFRNAGSGWSGVSTAHEMHENDDNKSTVTRKDWRAVCAVVIGSRDHETQVAKDMGGRSVSEDKCATGSVAEQFLQENDDEEDAEDILDEDVYEHSSSTSYSESGEDSELDSDSDAYVVGPSIPRRKNKSTPTQRHSKTVGAPTSRQKRAALEAYSLFFPSSPPLSDHALAEKRLMYKDIVRIAGLLKEKIKAEEIMEMLSLFSTSPDTSMSFDDFTRMMVMARLV